MGLEKNSIDMEELYFCANKGRKRKQKGLES